MAKMVKVIGVVVVVVAVGGLLGWLGTRGPRVAPPPLGVAASPKPVMASESASADNSAPNARMMPAAPRPRRVQAATPAASTNLLADWEDKLDGILGSEAEDADKAKQMLAIFPTLPEDGQIEVAQHLSNLVEDKDYASLQQYLTNSALPETVLDVLLGDALNRPNSLKLPALLAVARDTQNPKAPEAKDLLELFLEEDYGTDWSAWQTKMDQWLRDNPD